MYRVAGLIGKSVSRRAWCRDHMHLQTPPLPASTSRADMLRLNRETAVLPLACQSGIRLSSHLRARPGALGQGVPAAGAGDENACRRRCAVPARQRLRRSEEHTSELQSLMRISYAVLCLKKTKGTTYYKQQS